MGGGDLQNALARVERELADVDAAAAAVRSGDITRDAHSVTWACADGVSAGLAVHRSRVF